MNHHFSALTVIIAALAIAGCSKEVPQGPHPFEPNLVHAYKYHVSQGLPMDQVLSDADWTVDTLLGDANEMRLNEELAASEEDLATIVDFEQLKIGQQLYIDKQCYSCHGYTGDGRGQNAGLSNPYPRDFRKGMFKFKETELNSKPTREDLAERIRNGIPGTTMVKLPAVTDEEVSALVDYVIYLSWRGELERALIDDAVLELDIEGGDRLINPSHQNSTDEEEKELFDESWDIALEYATDIGFSWLEAEDDIVEVELPTDIPVPSSGTEFLEMMQGDDATALTASVKRGQEVFRGKIASCSKCHGNDGKGDGQTADYDAWTKDYTLAIDIKPENRDALIPLLARGALQPQNILPRNFAEGVFRGGSKPEDLYRRITVGIGGTPMPAVTFVPGEFEEPDVWHLINYVRSLGAEVAAKNEKAAAEQAVAEQAAAEEKQTPASEEEK